MRRFNQFNGNNNNEGEDEQEVQLLFESGMSEEDRYMQMVHAGIDSHQINQNTLSITLNILEKSFWWRFRSEKSKIRMIRETYNQINEMI